MAAKRGLFFTVDSFIALSLILVTIIIASSYYTYERPTTNVVDMSSDIMWSLSNIEIGEVDNAKVDALIKSGIITKLNNTLIEQIAEFWAKNKVDTAKELTEELIEALIPKQFGVSFVIDGEEIYKRDRSVTSSLVTSSKIISGITRDKPIDGFTTRLNLKKIREKLDSKYAYFGGFVGQGNITRFMSFPGDAAFDSITLEIDADHNFSLYINNNQCLGIFEPNRESFVADAWNISFCKNFLEPGYDNINYFTIEFLEGNISGEFIGGGFIRAKYTTSELTKPVSNTTRYWFPGITGVTNLFSSFHVPGNLSAISVFFHYDFNISTNSSIFLIFGNHTVYSSNDTGEIFANVSNQTIASEIALSDFDNNNMPLRLGTGESTGSAVDVALVTDLSTSMLDCVSDVKVEEGAEASFCGGDLFYENFEDDISVNTNWDKTGGNWIVLGTQNRIYRQNNDAQNTYAIENKANFSDFVFRVDWRANDDDRMGIYFRYNGPDNYYRLETANSDLGDANYKGFRLYRKINGNEELIAEDNSWGFEKNKWYTFYLSAIGDRIMFDFNKSVFVEPIFDLIDENGPINGSIGVYSNYHDDADFDNIFVGTEADNKFCQSIGYCKLFDSRVQGILYGNIVLSDLGSTCNDWQQVGSCDEGTALCYNKCENYQYIANCGGQGIGQTVDACCGTGTCCDGAGCGCGARNYDGQYSQFQDCDPDNVWDANSLRRCKARCDEQGQYELGTCATDPNPVQTWCYGFWCDSRPTDSNLRSTCQDNSNIYITFDKSPSQYLINDDFESALGGWSSRDGNMNVVQDNGQSHSGTASVRLQDTSGGSGSAHIAEFDTYSTANISKIEFWYKCEQNARWGWMFRFDNPNNINYPPDNDYWGCINGSGTSGCGAKYKHIGTFEPEVVCDDTWRYAEFKFNERIKPDIVKGGNNLGTIVGDWNSNTGNKNKKIWFDDVKITYESREFADKCGDSPLLQDGSPQSQEVVACGNGMGACKDPNFKKCTVYFTQLRSVGSCLGSTADHCQCFTSPTEACYEYSNSTRGYREHWRKCNVVKADGHWRKYRAGTTNYHDCADITGTYSCRNKYWNTNQNPAWVTRGTPHRVWGCDYCSYFYRQNFTVADTDMVTDLSLSIGSDDGVMCYINQKVAHYNIVGRGYSKWNEVVDVSDSISILQDGNNIISCQVIEGWGEEGFNAMLSSSTLVTNWVSGKVGNAMEFDGVDDYINVGNDASLNLQQMTAMAWIKNTVFKESNVLEKGGSGGYAFWLGNWGGNKIMFGKQTSNNWATIPPPSINEWHFLVGVADSTNFQIYLDGVPGVKATAVSFTNTGNLLIGDGADGNFAGEIDEVMIFNRILSDAEILQAYNDGIAGNPSTVDPTGLVAYWKLDETSGTTAADSSGNGHDGALQNPNRALVKADSQWQAYGMTDFCSNDGSSTDNQPQPEPPYLRWDPDTSVCEYGTEVTSCDDYYPVNLGKSLNVSAWTKRNDKSRYENGIVPVAEFLAQYNNGTFNKAYSGYSGSPPSEFWSSAEILIVDGDGGSNYEKSNIKNALQNGKIVITNWDNFWGIRNDGDVGSPTVNTTSSYNHRSDYFEFGGSKLIGDQYDYLAYRWKENVYDKRVKAANLFNSIYPVWYKGSDATFKCAQNYCLPGTGSSSCESCEAIRVKLAKKLDIIFAEKILDVINNKVSLVGYGSSVCQNHTLTSNMTIIRNETINMKSNCGATCISCAIEDAYKLLNDSPRNKFVFLMSDGEANTCLNGDVCGKAAASDEALDRAGDAYNESNIIFYTVGFGSDAGEDLLKYIAGNTTGKFCKGNDAKSLENCYVDFAEEIKFRSQVLTVGTGPLAIGEYSQFNVFPDSYVELNFTPDVPEQEFGKISVTPDPIKMQDCESTVTPYEQVKVTSARLTSYSGEHWTDYLSVNGIEVFNLSTYGPIYLTLGDPFILEIPRSIILNGMPNNIELRTADTPNNVTGCSKNNTFVYSGDINLSTAYTPVGASSNGCIWTIKFYDGEEKEIYIPNNYQGTDTCQFKPPQCNLEDSVFNADDTKQASAYELLEFLDFDDDCKVDIKFDNNQLDFSSQTVTEVPSLWGPAIVELRIWQ